MGVVVARHDQHQHIRVLLQPCLMLHVTLLPQGALSLAERDVKRMGAADTVRLSHKDAAVWVPPQV